MKDQYDAIIVGAGFAGLYALARLRSAGLSVHVLEMGSNVGGTWYWNRYPGARCDAESLAYSYSFSDEIQQSWQWSERYAKQDEILEYLEYVADHLDLKRDISFNRTVEAVHFDESDSVWRLHTKSHEVISADICVMATGCLTVPSLPDIPGLDRFAGQLLQASRWPKQNVELEGLRVGVIGTGSSAIQAIPQIAADAKQLTVFQRTPCFSVPAVNRPLDDSWVQEFKALYPEQRELQRSGQVSGFGDLAEQPRAYRPVAATAENLDESEVAALLEPCWQQGGAFFLAAIEDTMVNPITNQKVAEFVRNKIRAVVHDPVVAELLVPKSYPIGSKRICVDTGYYETFNRDNVTLVDIKSSPITRITETGIVVGDTQHDLDALVLATGFDAMTGALLKMDIRGRDGIRLRDVWAEGPSAYLGLSIHGFPNLWTITGPGSPSVLTNMVVSIEQHVDWMMQCLEYMRSKNLSVVEASAEAATAWVEHVNQLASGTLFPQAGSWYMGANVAGKPRVFMPYAGGLAAFRETCDEIARDEYRGFEFTE